MLDGVNLKIPFRTFLVTTIVPSFVSYSFFVMDLRVAHCGIFFALHESAMT